MRISRLVIKNFRSIESLTLDLPQICALVGPNNAGKSNILLAMQRVLGRDWVSRTTFDEDDVRGRVPDRDVSVVISVDPPVLYTKVKGTKPAEIATLSFEYTRYKVGQQKGQRRLEQGCLDATGKVPMVLAKTPKKGESHQYQPIVGIPSEVREAIPLIYVGTNRALKDHLPGGRYSLLRPLLEDVDRDFKNPAQTTKVAQASGEEIEVPRRVRFQDLMTEVMRLLRTDDFEKLEKAIKRNALEQLGFDPTTEADRLDLFFSPFDSIDFYQSLDLAIREGGFVINATELGEGIQNALVLAILKAFEERRKRGAIILIEEPEMFLHPQSQRSLYRTLREIGRHNQVVYTTHSPHFVAIPEYEEVVLVRREAQATSARRSTLPSSAKLKEKLVKEFDPERNELFFSSRLLLVEGDTEKLALPEYARRLNVDLDRAGATIVEVGGKRNLLECAKVASSFGIPTGVLYDQDSSDFKDRRGEESVVNAELDSLVSKGSGNRVWRLTKDYEDHLRKALGGEKYQELCQKHSYPKPTRARLIAAEPDLPIPEPVTEVVSWLGGKVDR